MRSTLQSCASAVSSAVAEEARKRPSSAAAAAPSPRRHGEKGQLAFSLKRNLHSCDSDCRPFAPRSGKKVVRQHRMRGRGRWDAIDAAVVRESHFIGGCIRSLKAPLIRRCRGTFSPSPRGEGTSMRSHQCATLHSCDSASLPSPRRHGEKGQLAFSLKRNLHSCDSASLPSPRAAGRRWCGSTG